MNYVTHLITGECMKKKGTLLNQVTRLITGEYMVK